MADEPSSGLEAAIVSAAATAVEVAEERAEIAEMVADDAIIHAQQRVEAAQQVADQVMDAALATSLGQSIESLRQEFYSWRVEEGHRAEEVRQLSSRLAEVEAKSASAQTLAAVSMMTASSELIPPPSEETLTGAMEEVAEVMPEAVSAVEESPAPEPAPRKARRRFL